MTEHYLRTLSMVLCSMFQPAATPAAAAGLLKQALATSQEGHAKHEGKEARKEPPSWVSIGLGSADWGWAYVASCLRSLILIRRPRVPTLGGGCLEQRVLKTVFMILISYHTSECSYSR